MRTPVPPIVYRPTRSAPATLLALLLLIVGGLGTWLTAYRFLTGDWPQRTVTMLGEVGAASLGSIAVLVAAGIAAAFGLFLLIAALWPVPCEEAVRGQPRAEASDNEARRFSSRRYPRADSTSPF